MPRKKQTGRWLAIAPIILVLIFASAYTVLFAIGPSHLGDDISYAYLAHYATVGTFTQMAGNILSVRVLHIFPIAIFYYLFGAGIYSSVAYDAISFAIAVMLTYLIGKELYNEKVGILAAFLLAIFPLAAIHAVTMSDNIPLMMFAALAFYAFLKGIKTSSPKWYIPSGIATCICGFIIPEGFIFWIVMGLFFLWKLSKDKFSIKSTSIFMVAGFLAVLAVMLLFNYINSGQPLITFTSNALYYSQLYRPDIAPQPAGITLKYYLGVMFPYKLEGGFVSILTQAGQGWNKVGLFFYALVPAIAYLVLKRDKRAALPLAWFFIGLLYLEFGPMYLSLHPLSYVFSHRLDRYLTLLAPPLCVIMAAAIYRVVKDSRKDYKLAKTVLLVIGIIILAVTSLEVTLLWHQSMVDSQYTELAIAGRLSALPNTTKIYFDEGYGDVAVYMNFDNVSRLYSDYDGITNCSGIPGGSYVVIPRFVNDGFNYTPNPSGYCGYWQEVLSPQVPYQNITAAAPSIPFQSDLYYVPPH